MVAAIETMSKLGVNKVSPCLRAQQMRGATFISADIRNLKKKLQ